jgi:hypothetical protein
MFDIATADPAQLASRFHELQQSSDKHQWESGDILAAIQQKTQMTGKDVAAFLGMKYSKSYLSKLQSVSETFKDSEREKAIANGATFYDCYQATRLANKKWPGRVHVSSPMGILVQIVKAKLDASIEDPYEYVEGLMRAKAAERWAKLKGETVPKEDGMVATEYADTPNPYSYHKINKRWIRAQAAAKAAALKMKDTGAFVFIVALNRAKAEGYSYGFLNRENSEKGQGDSAIAVKALTAQLERMAQAPTVRNLGKGKTREKKQAVTEIAFGSSEPVKA